MKISMKWMIGMAMGTLAGYLYWYYVGCASGSCAITSSPVNSSIYGGIMGVLMAGSFAPGKKEK